MNLFASLPEFRGCCLFDLWYNLFLRPLYGGHEFSFTVIGGTADITTA
jgi:hypothetical protein